MAEGFPSRPASIVFYEGPVWNGSQWHHPDDVFGVMNVSVVCTSRSEAFFCPQCGEVWGRRRDVGGELWWVRERLCRFHGDGSLLLSTDPVVALPRELMLRELKLMSDQERISR